MSIVTKPYTFPLTSPVIRSAEVNADYDVLYNDYNGNINNDNIAPDAGIRYDKLVPMSGDATITGAGVITVTGSGSGLLPIGTLVPFYDFNGALTFNTALWRYCDGSVLAYPASPLNGQTLPDLSGRYPVGFGTDGGGNIGTAPWATAPVGNAGNTVNLQHSHTVAGHTHTGPSHTHNVTAHTHSISVDGDHAHTGLTDVISNNTGFVGSQQAIMDDDGVIKTTHHFAVDAGVYNFEGQHRHGISTDGSHNHTAATGAASPTTDASGTGATGSAAPGTNNQLSSTQNIQPSSIRVRYIIKVL